MQQFAKKYRHRKQDWSLNWNDSGEVVLSTPRGKFSLTTLYCTQVNEKPITSPMGTRARRTYSGPDGSLLFEVDEQKKIRLTLTYPEWTLTFSDVPPRMWGDMEGKLFDYTDPSLPNPYSFQSGKYTVHVKFVSIPESERKFREEQINRILQGVRARLIREAQEVQPAAKAEAEG